MSRAAELASRLPIRAKVTLAFAGVMIVIFGGLALLLYTRFEASLDASISSELHARAAALATVVHAQQQASHRPRPALRVGAGAFAQVVDGRGRVLESTPGLGSRPLLHRDEVAAARGGTVLLARGGSRLLARPVGPGSRIEVVGISSGERDDALQALGDLLFIGGPVALVLTCAAGYALASLALAPVENMRQRAARISGARPSGRLPVPPARDELHRLGETLNEMLARLEEGLARERAFVADAGHELRTPLSILKLELDLTLAEARSREELELGLSSAAVEVDRLAKLAEELLVIARADQGRLPVMRERVDAQEVLEAIARRFAGRASSDGGAVTFAGAHGLAVEADRTRLEQALTNIVENALRYGAGPVTLSATERNASVELHVRDEGPGFPEPFLPRAFERFSRADAARSGGGAGLGLAIVRAIAEAHGGTAGVANRSAGGADVWLSLPRAADAAPLVGR